jgi:hypothetical protein
MICGHTSMPTPASALARIEMQKDRSLNREATAEMLLGTIAPKIDTLIAAGVLYVQLNGSVHADLLDDERDSTPFDAAIALDRRIIQSIKLPANVRIALSVERQEGMSWQPNEHAALAASTQIPSAVPQ